MKRKYVYRGGVRHFDNLVTSDFSCSTFAVSEAQAVQNILFRFKRSHGYSLNAGAFRLTKRPVLDARQHA